MGLFNPAIPTQIFTKSRNPDGYFQHPASRIPWTRSIPNLTPILLKNPESRPSNNGNTGSRKTCWGPSTATTRSATTMYLHHHGSRSRQSYHGGFGNQPLLDLLLNESQNQRYDYCVHHYPRNNPMRKTQILCRISDRVTLGNLSDRKGKGSKNVTWKLNSSGSKLWHSFSISFNLSSVEEFSGVEF